MKNKLVIATSLLLVIAGSAAAQTSESFFDDDFFTDSNTEDSNSDSDSFFEDDPFNNNDSDSQETDSFFGDDPFFNDEEDEGSQEENESEPDVGICVIGVDSPCNGEEYDGDNETDNQSDNDMVEERSVTEAPEPSYVGEDYLSYPNPRNHFLHDQGIHREGSMKVCKILLNQNGEVIEGDTVDATFSVETENVPYEDADNITFDTPINQVSDLVGTSEDLREGDGYLDAECAEYHDLKLNETYTYSQEEISGEDADEVETVGYIEKWENRNTPISNVENYGQTEDSDGTIRLEQGYNGRHAEVIIVNQIKN